MRPRVVFLLCAVCLASGFFAGRKSASSTEVVRYVKGDPVRSVVVISDPYKITVPDFPRLLYIPGTTTVDTAGIIADWEKRKSYHPVLFDNEYGRLELDFSVQYNEPDSVRYEFVPMQKEVIRTVVRNWRPFAGFSYGTLGHFGVECGVFFGNWGLDVRHVTDVRNNQSGYGAGLKYVF